MQRTGPKLSKGDWVFHPRMPGWGYGKIMELIGDNKGRVLFLLAGEKKLSWEHAGLGLVEHDEASRGALNEQLAEFKLNLARDIFTSGELSRQVTYAPCDSFSQRCELCKGAPENLRVYSLTQKGKMCLCDACRDKIMLETKDREEPSQSLTDREKKKRKPRTVAKKPK